jgi:hypothetical protein
MDIAGRDRHEGEGLEHDRGARRFLLPHERWLVGWVLARQRRRRTAAVLRLEEKYGPTGMVWLDAYLVNMLLGVIPALAGWIPIMVSGTKTSRLALYLLGVTCLFMALGAIRLVQASRAGRQFRATRH